jgi:radical SAM superfamily enzyme YgiQ (UPF0313 family)
VDAGFKKVFVGIETPDPEKLRACNKLHNARRDLLQSVRAIQAAGMEVMGGFIIGFDGDGANVFRRQFAFIQRAGIVTAMVGLLTALPRTRLYRRLVSEGRLLDESGGNNTEATCNFATTLARDELVAGYRRLMLKLYEPNTYYERARILLQSWRPRGPRAHAGKRELGAALRSLWELGVLRSGRRAYWGFMGHALFRHPRALGAATSIAIYGHHFRTVARSL